MRQLLLFLTLCAAPLVAVFAGAPAAATAANTAQAQAPAMQRIIDQLPYCDERKDLGLYETGISAEWSLASNLRSHPRVKSALEQAQKTATGRTRAIIADTLTLSPDAITQQMVDTFATAKAAGTWAD